MADQFTGLLGDVLGYMQDPNRTQALQGIGGLLQGSLSQMQKSQKKWRDLNDRAFADKKNPAKITDQAAFEELTNMTMEGPMGVAPVGMIAKAPQQAADALMTVAPFAPKGMKMIRATKGMPVGMSIKDVGSKIKVKPATDDVYEVMDATFNYGKLGGNKTIPIDKLTGGVRMTDPTEARRVKELADKISSPEGYISRIIVDDSGNVLEGQHRLEALRLLGEKNVPVSVIEDLSNKYDISAMENAIQGKLHPDQVTQLVREAIDTMEEAGSVEKALSDYSMPAIFQQPFQDAIRASQKVTPTPIESPTFTDPFGNTIGSSIR